MYFIPKITREDAHYDTLDNNRLLQAAGVAEESAYFDYRYLGDSYEVALVLGGGKLTFWFNNWDEAHKLVMGKFPNADWDETGWNL